MAQAVCRFTEKVRDMALPVMMAGQVFEHMAQDPSPTRSEVCYVHDMLMKGYRGLVLSDETAVGVHAAECCRVAALFRGRTP